MMSLTVRVRISSGVLSMNIFTLHYNVTNAWKMNGATPELSGDKPVRPVTIGAREDVTQSAFSKSQ